MHTRQSFKILFVACTNLIDLHLKVNFLYVGMYVYVLFVKHLLRAYALRLQAFFLHAQILKHWFAPSQT